MGENGSEGQNTLSIRDNRTGKNYEVDIHSGDVIRAMDLRQIKVPGTTPSEQGHTTISA